MKKYFLILILGFIISANMYAQADCSFRYSYTGSIEFKSKSSYDSSVILQLPSPELLLEIIDEERGFIMGEADVEFKFKSEAVTIGSSMFCGTPDSIIEGILKGKREVYSIYIISNGSKYKKNINIADIVFLYKNGTIYINLPPIVI